MASIMTLGLPYWALEVATLASSISGACGLAVSADAVHTSADEAFRFLPDWPKLETFGMFSVSCANVH
jgi:hypothetical protein